MQVVHIYAESDTETFRSCERSVGYVMELRDAAGGTKYTKEGWIRMIGTYNQAILAAFNEALSRMRMPCEIHFHTHNHFVSSMISCRTLDLWEKSGFRNGKGKEISNADLWVVFSQRVKGHLITSEEGLHSYYHWMIEQMNRREPA